MAAIKTLQNEQLMSYFLSLTLPLPLVFESPLEMRV